MESGKWKIRFYFFLKLALDVLMLDTNIRISSSFFGSNVKVLLLAQSKLSLIILNQKRVSYASLTAIENFEIKSALLSAI